MASRRSRAQQTKLSFSPISGQTGSARVLYEPSPRKKRRIDEFYQQQAIGSDGPSSSAAKATLKSPLRSSQAVRTDREDVPIYTGDSDARIDETPPLSDIESDTSEDSLIVKTPKKKRSKPDGRRPAKESPRIFSQPPKRKQKSISIDISSSDTSSIDSSEEENDAQAKPRTPVKKRLVRGSPQKSSDHGISESESDSDIIVASTQRNRRLNAKDASTESEDAEDIIPTSSRRRRPQHDSHSVTSEEQNEPEDSSRSDNDTNTYERDKQDEIDEDAEDLKTSTVFRDELAASKPSKRDMRRQQLERLKAKRATRDDASPVKIEDDKDDDELHDHGYGPDDALAMNDEDELDGWVVEGEEEVGDSNELMPLEMMRHGQKNLRDHWMYVVKWLLQTRLNPGGLTELEELYALSVSRVHNECQGLIARLISTAWTPLFVRALKARPNYAEAPIDGSSIEGQKCSACNRTGHPAKYQVNLTGKAYDKKTLEPLKDDDDDDEDSVDEEGYDIIDEGRDFMLGTFCRSNAMNAHAILHWQMDLKDWINAYLKGKGYLKSKRIVEREKWSTKKRSKLVEEIMVDLEGSGAINKIWRQFKEKLLAAPNVHGQKYWR